MTAEAPAWLLERCKELLDLLLLTHAPSGHESEMRRACSSVLTQLGLPFHIDRQGNIIVQLGEGAGPALGFMAHMDEVALMVSRIHDDGKMEVEPIGGAYFWAFGEGPWEVLGDEPVVGVLSVGSVHVSERSGDLFHVKSAKAVDWGLPRLDCKLSPEELSRAGVAVGRPVCVARSRKKPIYMGDYVGGYALDDKGGVVVLLLAAEILAREEARLTARIYLVFTGAEEIGTHGAARVAHTLPVDAAIAVDVAPVAPEYPVRPGPVPVVIFKDSYAVYSPRLSEFLAKTCEEVTGDVQRTVVRSYGSDASGNLQRGLVSTGALLGFPTENTHGFEVAHLGGLVNCARVVAQAIRTAQEALTDESLL
ncbi:MAG: M20/M25/M40 family metallo-hydrolase [Armatimonadetes bacterium]|nr:M20/M25/M40 family metallo-hydrolase [Armatimonadota bacterium]